MSFDVTLKFTSAENADECYVLLQDLMPTIGFDYIEGKNGSVSLTLTKLTSEDLFIIDQLVEHEHL